MSILTYSGAPAPVEGLVFEAAPQPSFNAQDPGHVWDGVGRGIDEFIADMFDPLIATAGGYITRSVLGKDASDTYDIIEYDFNPPGATQTILLTYGVHGRETVPVYSAYRLAHYLINDPDAHPYFRYLRDTVRIKMLPAVGVWAGSQDPKVYSNANNVNSNANAPAYREFQPITGTVSGRGPAPLSEPEASVRVEWFLENKDASFHADWHTDYSFYGQLPSKDVWVIRSDEDQYTKSVLDPISLLLGARAERIREEPAEVLLESSISTVRLYAHEVIGIPSFTAEFCETRFGGRFGGSEDITNHLTMMVNLIVAMCKSNLRSRIDADCLKVGADAIANFHFPPANMFNDRVNVNWGLADVYSAIDSLAASHADYVSVETIGRDASNTYDIRAVTLDPGSAEKTICLIAGADSAAGVDTTWMLRISQMLAEEAERFGLTGLRDRMKLVWVPTMNPWGYNAHAVDLETVVLDRGSSNGAISRERVNSNGVRPDTEIGPGGAAAEAVAVRSYLESNVPLTTPVIGLGSQSGDAIIVAVRRHDSANHAISDLAFSLGEDLLDSGRPMVSSSPTVSLNNNVHIPASFANGLQALGYSNAAHLRVTSRGFRRFGENINGNRPTSSAMIAYLLDLLRGVSEL